MIWTLMVALFLADPSLGPPVPSQPTAPRPPVAAGAQPAGIIPSAVARGPLSLNLAQALERGLQHDRDVRIAKLGTVSARAGETDALSVYQPQLAFAANANEFNSAVTAVTTGAGSGATDSWSINFKVSQLLFDLGQGLFGIYRNHQLVRAAVLNELVAQLTAASRISTDFYAVLQSVSTEKLNAELLAQAQRQEAAAQARFEGGNGSRLDVLRATVGTKNAELDLDVAATKTRTGLAALRNDLGLAPGTPLVVTDETKVPAVEIGLQDALGLSGNQPSIGVRDAQQRAQKHALDAARLQRWVTMQWTGSYTQYVESSRDVDHEYSLAAQLSIPIWDGLSGRAQADQARAAWLQAVETAKKEREQVQTDIEQSWLSWHDSDVRLALADNAVTLAADSLAQTEESYRQQVASTLDVSDARTAYAQAENNRIAARLSRDLAALSLRVAVGRMPLAELVAAKLGVKEPAR